MNGPVISNPAYRIETERLVIRCCDPQDAALMQQATAESKEHLLPFMPWAADEPQTVEQKAPWCTEALRLRSRQALRLRSGQALRSGQDFPRWPKEAVRHTATRELWQPLARRSG